MSRKLGLAQETIVPVEEHIVDFSREKIDTRRYINFYTKFGEGDREYRTIKVKYLIVDANTSDNVLLERPSLNKLATIVSISTLS